MSRISRVTVFLGSSMGARPEFAEAARAFGRAVAERGAGLVYGGGRVGLMGVVADAGMAAGGEVVGVIPQHLLATEVADNELTSLEIVPDMHARKLRMAELGDAFVALPGGAGTLEELFEAWTWLQLGIHRKPVALLDVDGFWSPLIAAIDHMTSEGFVREPFRETLIVSDDIDALLTALEQWEPPAPKGSAPRP
ncbi:TIGR00730 family Rossman fold protein [Microbacterium oryzae]|uniref:Cytokinin riboside 5'-monophosphate phosphoribohydrolase n=1 Tax=Microbacterium oryzae TaxID=743009 RepID=A0A6I6DPJ4_9MICO|nr:TIGR00730 family Rossman fold protein [Microbacterium oryzae]QGU26855.1 TIGR00730 family Rossman fold protein [Microbacterium oryzae]